jgi:hypothetical protein
MQSKEASPYLDSSSKWRFRLGAFMFVLSLVLPLAGVPIVTSMTLSVTMTSSISGGLLACGELLGIGAIIVMGKSGYTFLKSKVFGFFKNFSPPSKSVLYVIKLA